MKEKIKSEQSYYPPLKPEQSTTSKFITAIVIIGIISFGIWILSWLYPDNSSSNNLPNNEEARKTNQQSNDRPILDCRMRDFSIEYLQGFSDGISVDYEINQEYVDELNSIPRCKDFCKEQLMYSKEYDDWFAEDDLRETCKSIGIILPK